MEKKRSLTKKGPKNFGCQIKRPFAAISLVLREQAAGHWKDNTPSWKKSEKKTREGEGERKKKGSSTLQKIRSEKEPRGNEKGVGDRPERETRDSCPFGKGLYEMEGVRGSGNRKRAVRVIRPTMRGMSEEETIWGCGRVRGGKKQTIVC